MVCKRLGGLQVSGKSCVFLLPVTGSFFWYFGHVEVFVIFKWTRRLDLGVCDTGYLLKLEDNFKGKARNKLNFILYAYYCF